MNIFGVWQMKSISTIPNNKFLAFIFDKHFNSQAESLSPPQQTNANSFRGQSLLPQRIQEAGQMIKNHLVTKLEPKMFQGWTNHLFNTMSEYLTFQHILMST